MAVLHCDPTWAHLVHAWRAYEQPDIAVDLLVYIQTAFGMQHLRDRFPVLPRLHMSSMDRMLLFLVDSPGLFGLCAFSGGHFTRALRRVNRNLLGRFEDAAPPAPPPPPPSPQRPVLIDLSLEPDTPDLRSRSPALSPS